MGINAFIFLLFYYFTKSIFNIIVSFYSKSTVRHRLIGEETCLFPEEVRAVAPMGDTVEPCGVLTGGETVCFQEPFREHILTVNCLVTTPDSIADLFIALRTSKSGASMNTT